MAQTPESMQHMLSAWNETDLDQIRKHIDKALSDDVIFADPKNFIEGKDSFERMVKEFRAEYPKAVCALASGMDSHNNRYRYNWSIFVGNELLLPGFDVVTLNDEGLVERVDGFFGPLPPLENT